AEALLDRGHTRRWRLGQTHEVGLHLDHAGGCEEQGRVVYRDKGGGRDAAVTPGLEKLGESVADLAAIHKRPFLTGLRESQTVRPEPVEGRCLRSAARASSP